MWWITQKKYYKVTKRCDELKHKLAALTMDEDEVEESQIARKEISKEIVSRCTIDP